MNTLSRDEQTTVFASDLASTTDHDPETRKDLQNYLDYLKTHAKEPARNCRLVSNTTATETPLVQLLLDPHHLSGYGLSVVLNGQKSTLMLDTGASGILIDRRIAEKGGLTRLAETRLWGIGDKGDSSGWIALADTIKVGALEFKDCPVQVLDKRSVLGDDGLIGADVFEDFLVDLDFPKEKLRLTPLPVRPEENASGVHLRSEKDDPASPADTAASKTGTGPEGGAPKPSGPLDRYIAPEMKSYTQVFRFGHALLVPTQIGQVAGKLFLLDTGSLDNSITPSAAREITKVHDDSDTTVKGLSGSVKNVYSADKAVLQFGRLRQENQDLLTMDFTSISNSAGTEISGTLGFVLLHFLDVKIDYRDGLVNFEYQRYP
jgi:predicted aspartyl protease